MDQAYCTASVGSVMGDPQCKTACGSRVNTNVRCSETSVLARIDGRPPDDLLPTLISLITALGRSYGTTIATAEKLKRIADTGQVLIELSQALPQTVVGPLGDVAVQCITTFAAPLRSAQADVSASTMIAASINTSVSGL
jgi:hypothetical protein